MHFLMSRQSQSGLEGLGNQREAWSSDGRSGLGWSPGVCCHAPMCECSVRHQWHGEIYQQIRLRENSQVPGEGWYGLFSASFPLSFHIILGPRRVFFIMSMWCSTQRQSCSLSGLRAACSVEKMQLWHLIISLLPAARAYEKVFHTI